MKVILSPFVKSNDPFSKKYERLQITLNLDKKTKERKKYKLYPVSSGCKRNANGPCGKMKGPKSAFGSATSRLNNKANTPSGSSFTKRSSAGKLKTKATRDRKSVRFHVKSLKTSIIDIGCQRKEMFRGNAKILKIYLGRSPKFST